MKEAKEPSGTDFYFPASTDDSFNLGCVPDFHAWQKHGKNYAIGFEEAEYFRELAERYDLDAVCINGDFGSYDAVDGFLEGIDGELPVYIIEGDEDRSTRFDGGEPKIGWKQQINSGQPFDTETDYFLEGRTMRLQPFESYEVWLQHEPRWEDPEDDLLFNIDPMKRKQDYDRRDVPIELLGNPVIACHAHNHRPQTMEVGRSGVISLGASKNYGVTQLMPDSSAHVLRFAEDYAENIHIDRDVDQVFEHHRFDLKDVNREIEAPAREEFRKNLVYAQEAKDLSPLERFVTVPPEVRVNETPLFHSAD